MPLDLERLARLVATTQATHAAFLRSGEEAHLQYSVTYQRFCTARMRLLEALDLDTCAALIALAQEALTS